MNRHLAHTTNDLEYQLRRPTLAGMAMAAAWVIGTAVILSIIFDHPFWQFH